MKYRVVRSDIANSQLEEIIRYITNPTDDIQSALNLLDDLDKATRQLEDSPESGINPRDIAVKRSGYRYLLIRSYYMFYKIDHAARTVVVYAFIYAKSDYKQLL